MSTSDSNSRTWPLVELAETIGATVEGDASLTLTGYNTLEAAGPGDVSFLANTKYVAAAKTTRAGAIVVSPEHAKELAGRTLLVADDPYFAWRNVMVEMIGFRQQPAAGVSERASVHPTATVHPGVHVGPFVTIDAGAVVGERSVLYPGVYVGPDARIGGDCILYPNVVVYDRCVLGDRVTLHAGCVIGQDGFGYATHAGAHHKIPQSGNAVVEDDVELGAGCSVDRATVGSTVIGKGTKFSNAVTIGHGTKVGPHNLYVAQVGLAGSVQTGSYVVMGGQVGVAGHLKIGNNIKVAATSAIYKDVPDGCDVGGTPALPLSEARRLVMSQLKLPDALAELKRLKKQVEKLEKQLNQP